jgi:hypothetical protein
MSMRAHLFNPRFLRHTARAAGLVLLTGLTICAMADEAAPASAATPATVEAAPADAPAPPTSDPPAQSRWVHGRFETGIEAVWDDSESDLELHQNLRVDVDPPQVPRLHIRGSLWTTEDLDGDEQDNSSLYGIDDAYDGDIRARLLDLYAEIEDVFDGATLRIGRQRILDGPLFNRIDGLHLNWNGGKWDVYAYGGVRASLYDSDENDLALGGGAAYQLTATTRLGFDAFYGRERRKDDGDDGVPWRARIFQGDYPRTIDTDLDNHLVAVNLFQRFGENHWLSARAQFHEDGAHEFGIDVSGYVERLDVTYLVSYHHQLDRIEDRINQATGFYRVLGAQERYHHFHLDLQRPLTKKLTLGLQSDWRLSGDDSVYTANRDYLRVATVLTGKDLYKGIGFSLALERWDASGADNFWLLTGEVGRKWGKYDLALGADYEQYRDEVIEYNPWPNRLNIASFLFIPGVSPGFRPGVLASDTSQVVTRESIYSLYLRFKYAINETQQLSTRVTFEEDDGSDAPYWRVQAAYEIEF